MTHQVNHIKEKFSFALEAVLKETFQAKGTISPAHYTSIFEGVSQVAHEVFKRPPVELTRPFIYSQRQKLIETFKGLSERCITFLNAADWRLIPFFTNFITVVNAVNALDFHMHQMPILTDERSREECEQEIINICYILIKCREWAFVEKALTQISHKWERFWLFFECCNSSYQNGEFAWFLDATVHLIELLTTLKPDTFKTFDACLSVIQTLQRIAHKEYAKQFFENIKDVRVKTQTAKEEVILCTKAATIAFDLKYTNQAQLLLGKAVFATVHYEDDLLAIEKLISIGQMALKFNYLSQAEKCVEKISLLLNAQTNCPEWLSPECWNYNVSYFKGLLKEMKEDLNSKHMA